MPVDSVNMEAQEAERRRKRWNLFIEDVCNRERVDLSPVQKKAVLCFWYDAEVNSGGHLGYFDSYQDTDPAELAEALRCIGTEEMAQNYLDAVHMTEEESDGWEEMDSRYYEFSPTLTDLIEQYVEDHRTEMFAVYPNTVRVQWGYDYDDAKRHFTKPVDVPKLNGYSHIGIFLRWMAEHDLLSRELLEAHPDLPDKIKGGKVDAREILKKEADFRGCICCKHFNQKGQKFAEDYYDSAKEDGYPACVDRYALKYFGEEKYNSPEFHDEAYLFVPYDEAYYIGLSSYIDAAWRKHSKKRESFKERRAKKLAEKLVKDILNALHEKRYGAVRKLVDESEIDDLKEFLEFAVQGALDDNGYDSVDLFETLSNSALGDEAPQLQFYEYSDGSGFAVEYDLTSNSEPMDLALQLEFIYTTFGVKTVFQNIDPQ